MTELLGAAWSLTLIEPSTKGEVTAGRTFGKDTGPLTWLREGAAIKYLRLQCRLVSEKNEALSGAALPCQR